MRRAARAARAVVAAVAMAALTGASGCGKPVLRVADASLGDYYTEKEFKQLSDEQREEYCNELANQRDLFLEQIASAEKALENHRLQTEPRRRELDSLRVAAAELESRLAEVRNGAPGGGGTKDAGTNDAATKDGEAKDGTAAGYTVRPGDSLWRIAARGDVYGRGARWKRLYGANQNRIRNPDRIYPGQEIQIPR